MSWEGHDNQTVFVLIMFRSMQGERKGKSKRKSKCDKREGRGDHQREGCRGDQCRRKAAEIKRSGVSQRANPQNQNLREESIFKGNDVSRSSKVRQGQNLERAKPDSGHRILKLQALKIEIQGRGVI